MWLHNYLSARAEMSEYGEEGPKNSLACLIHWSTFYGLRTKILSKSRDFLVAINSGYMTKFDKLPDNALTRSMLICGVLLGIIAPITMMAIDATVFCLLAVVFLAGWTVGGGLSVIAGGLGWIVGGTSAAEKVFKLGTTATEDLMFFVLSLLRIPAGAINLCGLIPSLVLESVSEGVNYGCISTLKAAYDCKEGRSNTNDTPAREIPNPVPTNSAPTTTIENTVNSQLLESNKSAMLNSYKAGSQAQDAIVGDVLEDVMDKTLPPPRKEKQLSMV